MKTEHLTLVEELQLLRSAPAKVAKPAKVLPSDPSHFSNFSRFSRGASVNTQISPLRSEQAAPVVSPTPEPVPFYDDAREGALATDASWHCSYCSRPLMVDEVCLSLDGERTLTLWRCDLCGVAGATPDAIKEPPVWVKTSQQ